MFSPLLPHFSWVLPARLAGCGEPARGLPSERPTAYRSLYDAGVRVVVCLLEGPPPWGLIRDAGLDALHFPILDHATPIDLDAFAALIDQVHGRIEAGEPAVAHCYAGIGRTGMFLGAWLARHAGLDGDAAVQTLRDARPYSLETRAQIDVVRQLARPG